MGISWYDGLVTSMYGCYYTPSTKNSLTLLDTLLSDIEVSKIIKEITWFMEC